MTWEGFSFEGFVRGLVTEEAEGRCTAPAVSI